MTSLVSEKPAVSEAISLNGELAVLRFRKTKRFGVFRNFGGNFNAVRSFIMLFCAVQPPPQALRFSHGRGERETSDW